MRIQSFIQGRQGPRTGDMGLLVVTMWTILCHSLKGQDGKVLGERGRQVASRGLVAQVCKRSHLR